MVVLRDYFSFSSETSTTWPPERRLRTHDEIEGELGIGEAPIIQPAIDTHVRQVGGSTGIVEPMSPFHGGYPVGHAFILTGTIARAAALSEHVVPTTLSARLANGESDGDPPLSTRRLSQIPEAIGCTRSEVQIETRAPGIALVPNDGADTVDFDGAGGPLGIGEPNLEATPAFGRISGVGVGRTAPTRSFRATTMGTHERSVRGFRKTRRDAHRACRRAKQGQKEGAQMPHGSDVIIDCHASALLSSRGSVSSPRGVQLQDRVVPDRCSMRRGVPAWLIAITVLCSAASPFVVGCTGTQTSTGSVRLARTAKVNYERGMAELDGKSADRARRYFKFVRREFPYSRYAALAELRLADCEFVEENWAEAASSYRRFMRLHRTHPNADHAAYRRGLSFHKMIPSDWFLVPPSYERDMSATRDALREARNFLKRYPTSEYRPDATELEQDCLARLAKHEMYVARFYLRRGKHQAAINRTKVVEERFADSGMVPEAMFVRGETFLNMDDNERAQETFVELATRFPESPEAGRANDYLRHLGVAVPVVEPDEEGERASDDEP